jgi:dihydroneopterin aldolase
MLTIHLHNVKFFAYHGLYEEEKIKGNEFLVNVIIHYRPGIKEIHHIHETINYADVFTLVQKRMQEPTPLLETLAMQIAQQIIHTFHLAEKVFVSVAKLKPPIDDFDGKVIVSYEMHK